MKFKNIMAYSAFCSAIMCGGLWALNKTQWYQDYKNAMKESKEYIKWYNEEYKKSN